MSSSNRRVFRAAAVVTAAALSAASIIGSPPATAAGLPPAAAANSITLISGDIVAYDRTGSAVRKRSRPGVAYRSFNRDDKLFVIPSDAEAGLRSGLHEVQIGLKRNGQTVTGRTQDLMTVFDVPAAADSYELSLKYQPNGTASGTYRTESTYTFTSAQATQEESSSLRMCGRDRYVENPDPNPCEAQKVDIIDYDINVDLDNTMPVGVQRVAFFKLRPLKGTPTTTLQAWISYNEGASWTALSLTALSNGNYGTILTNPTVGNVSLKVQAADSAASQITETLYNAYRIK